MAYFTVGIPTYHRAAMLGRCIETILGQSFGDLRLIIADNASPDDTRGVVASFNDPRIVYHRHAENLGSAGNFAWVAGQADTPFFVMCQDDDRLHRDFLARAYAATAIRDDVVMYAAPHWRWFEASHQAQLQTAVYDPSGDGLLEDVRIVDGSLAAVSLFYALYFTHPSIAFRTEKFRAVGGYRQDVATGLFDLMTIATVLVGEKLAYDTRPGAFFRDHTANYSVVHRGEGRRQFNADRYRPLIEIFENAHIDWATLLRGRLKQMPIQARLQCVKEWARRDAPAELLKLGHTSVAADLKNNGGTKKLLKVLGWRNTLRILRSIR